MTRDKGELSGCLQMPAPTTRDELCEVLKQSEDLEQLLTDLLAAKQVYDEKVGIILRRTYDDD